MEPSSSRTGLPSSIPKPAAAAAVSRSFNNGSQQGHNRALSLFPYPRHHSKMVVTFALWFQKKFRVMDILINNAAVSFNDLYENSVDHAEIVMKTNFYGVKFAH
ncbi:putative proteinD(P)-BINDING ROSSMANN-FOLD SUPERFAMILY PROTEIN [Salix koriyanagi]|uniref:Uncharacterized protein n=1 Tax=Salix koriyanagi TaxID=2511006 RepID=A0A9Q0W052_9ROSI|nr:putative proteinD(P)-BINDING ROSSMANN-FOLD SUPERFAMILY PROTEIN [Salix koriyanagi]